MSLRGAERRSNLVLISRQGSFSRERVTTLSISAAAAAFLPKLNSQAPITTSTMGVIADGHCRSAVWCDRLSAVAARRDAGQRHVGVQRSGGFRGRLA